MLPPRHIWIQPTASFQSAVHAASRGSIRHANENTICPAPPCTCEFTNTLMSQWLTEDRVRNPSHPESLASLFSWVTGHGWLWHHWDLNSQSPNDWANNFLFCLVNQLYSINNVAIKFLHDHSTKEQTKLIIMIKTTLLKEKHDVLFYKIISPLRFHLLNKSLCLKCSWLIHSDWLIQSLIIIDDFVELVWTSLWYYKYCLIQRYWW